MGDKGLALHLAHTAQHNCCAHKLSAASDHCTDGAAHGPSTPYGIWAAHTTKQTANRASPMPALHLLPPVMA
jgi:hypothetical protein